MIYRQNPVFYDNVFLLFFFSAKSGAAPTPRLSGKFLYFSLTLPLVSKLSWSNL